MSKSTNELLADIETAITLVVGPKNITPESLLRRDLDVQSLDLVEIFFELKRITGCDAVSAALFAAAHQHGLSMDIQVGQLLEILSATVATSIG